MPHFEHDGLALHYATLGDPETPPVVLLHDTGEDSRSWYPLALALSRDFFVVSPDLRGHGLSDAPEAPGAYALELLAGDLGAMLDELGLDLAAVGGQGLGALVALEFAVEHPERAAGLVLCDATPAADHPSYDDGLHEYEEALRSFAGDAGRYGMHRLAKDAASGMADAFLGAGVRQVYLRLSPEALAGAAYARQFRHDLTALLPERLAGVPVLLCYGELGPFGTAAALMSRQVSQARVAVFRGVAMAPHIAAADAFCDQVYAFFDAIERGEPVAGSVTV